VAGGLAGKVLAEDINPTAETTYWKSNFKSVVLMSNLATNSNTYAPAYRYGWESYGQHTGKSFDEVESDLGRIVAQVTRQIEASVGTRLSMRLSTLVPPSTADDCQELNCCTV